MPVRDLYEMKGLFKRLSEEDESAFKILFELYKKKVFAVAIKMIKSETAAEEIVQDVFLNIWIAKGRLGDVNDPEAYLFIITYNTIYAQLKKASRDQKLLNTILDKLTEIQNNTEETLAAHETERIIHEALLDLSPQQKTIYNLSRHEGLSYEEIADRLKISRNTVRNHLAEALKNIRLYLKKMGTFFFFVIALLSK